MKTIQRLRNDEEYPTSKQTVLALCVRLRLSPAEAEDLFDKTDFKLNTKKTEDYIYKCVLGACSNNSIYAINEMLKNTRCRCSAVCQKNNRRTNRCHHLGRA